MSLLVSYKNRTAQYFKTAQVYKNLTLGCYSIRQNGLVVAHAKKLILTDVTFKVGESRRQKVLKTKIKNVHAYAEGILAQSAMGISEDDFAILPARISYNPFKYGCFYCENLTNQIFGVESCLAVKFNEDGLTGSYLNRCVLKV